MSASPVVIDLRSDTVTKPSPEMLQAMVAAEVGDDVFGEDPTVNKLQQRMAELTGKEAALFVPSGTMANQIAIRAHTEPGDEVYCESRAHIFNYESGSASALAGVQLHPLFGKYGVIDVEELAAVIRPGDHHFPKSKLVVLENTHNRWGGTVYPLPEIKKMRAFAQEKGLKMHLDGARLWNASVATGISLKEYGRYFDSLSLCFSKGLGAPVGSIIVGSKDFIARAHRFRKMYGGGMRQAGILAAAALYALENNFERLLEDHRRARMLAERLNELNGLVIDLQAVQTNIVIIDTSFSGRPAQEIAARLSEKGVKMIAFSPTAIRAVTHLHISDKDIEYTVETFKQIL